MSASFAGLPAPNANQLVMYAIGPGFGESQVVGFPDGSWLVVDSCRQQNTCLPRKLLEHFGVSTIDLLVATHPDLDHIDGMEELVEHFHVRRAWRFPKAGQLRSLVSRWCRKMPNNHRLVSLHRAMKALDDLAEVNQAWDVAYGHAAWASPSGVGRVVNLAPTQYDQERAWRGFESLVKIVDDTPELAERAVRYLTKHRKDFGDHPNLVSLALAVECAGSRLLLAGDVECGDATPYSGWQGILGLLEEDGAIEVVTDLDAVKLAHQGSENAFDDAAWGRHANSRPVPVVTCLPYNRGAKLPQQGALTRLKRYANWLVVTRAPDFVRQRAMAAGWQSTTTRVVASSTAPCAAIVFESGRPPEIHAGPTVRCHTAEL